MSPGVGIGAALGMLPAPPPVDGVLGAGVVLEMRSDSLAIRGDVSVTELSYGKQRFGDVALGVRYGQGRGRRADARVTLDGSEVFAAHGDLRPDRDEPLDLTLTVPGFPLQRLDVFLPADLLRLSGEVQAAIHVGGAPKRETRRRGAFRRDRRARADDRDFVPASPPTRSGYATAACCSTTMR